MGGGRRGRGWGGGGGGGEGLGFWMGEGGRRHSLTSARLPGRTWRWLGIVLWGWGGEGVPRLSSRITSSPARHKMCHTPDFLLHSRLNLSKDHGGISEPATSKSRTKKPRFSTQPYHAASAAAGPTSGPASTPTVPDTNMAATLRTSVPLKASISRATAATICRPHIQDALPRWPSLSRTHTPPKCGRRTFMSSRNCMTPN